MVSIVQFLKLEDLVADRPQGTVVYEALVEMELSRFSHGLSRHGLVSVMRFHVPGSRIGSFSTLHEQFDRVYGKNHDADTDGMWDDARAAHADMVTWLKASGLLVRRGMISVGDEKLIMGQRWTAIEQQKEVMPGSD